MSGNPVYTVAQVNQYIKSLLDGDKLLSSVFVRGEISNYKPVSYTHLVEWTFSNPNNLNALMSSCVRRPRAAAGMRQNS